MTVPETAARAMAQRLADARHRRQGVDGLPQVASFDDAYAVQDAFVGLWPNAAIGHKVGCSSEQSQRLVNAPGPIAGRLFRDAHWTSPADVPCDAFFLLGVEAEFGFRLGSDLPPRGAPWSREAVADAVAAVVPLIEICDTRLDAWRTRRIEEITADNAFHGGVVTGTPVANWRGLDLLRHEVSLAIDGTVAGSGTGALVLGHPLAALTWLANALRQRGMGLRAGELVAAGTCTGLHIAPPGSAVRADFGTLGTVDIRFAACGL